MSHTVKILIVRFSSIGDIVLTTPVVRCLKEQLEGEVEIHYLTKKGFKGILENNPSITKVHTIEKSTVEVVEELKSIGFDYIIDLHKNLRSKRIRKNLKVLTFSFNKLNYKKMLLTRFKINKLPEVHIVDRYFEPAKILGVENDLKGLDYFIPKEDEVTLSELPDTHQNGYIGFAIGGQHGTKKMPVDRIISICKEISSPIVLLGGKEDVSAATQIEKEVGENIYNACGKYNLNQSASLVKQANVLITHDTGLMHIAAALGTKTISVWGNTVPEFGMYSYFPKNPENYKIIENKELSCRPCSKIGYEQCPKKHFKCMNEIPVKSIVDSVQELS